MENNNSRVNGNQTRNNLLHAGIHLFSKFGYDATSTRMIADYANANLSAISFHFASKENLYKECLQYVASKAGQYYEETFNKVNDYLNNENRNPKLAYDYISELIDLQIKGAFDFKYRKTLGLIYWEQNNPMHNFFPLTNTIFEKIEKIFAELLLIATRNRVSYERAVIASRYVNGSIISFGEHDLIVRYSLNMTNNDQELPSWIRNEIQYYCHLVVKSLIALAENSDPRFYESF
jgi:AcrR family transcriptional regulator